MKNFIFKSEADFHKIVFNKLEILLAEQRAQRSDLSIQLAILQRIINSLNLQKQVDEYFEETPPQTESEKQNDTDRGN